MKDEKNHFVENVKKIVDSWMREDRVSDKNKCVGVAFDILSLLDGCSLDSNRNYMLYSSDGESKSDNISGALHDDFFKDGKYNLD